MFAELEWTRNVSCEKNVLSAGSGYLLPDMESVSQDTTLSHGTCPLIAIYLPGRLQLLLWGTARFSR